MAEYAGRLENSVDTIDRVRRIDALGLTPAGNPTLARSGLRPDGGGAVTVDSGLMSVSVTAFAAWIDAGSDGAVGYPLFLDAGKTLAISAGHATLDRVDTVVAQVRDTAYDGSGSTDARVYVVEGTPGAGAPAVPSGAVPLQDISVHAGASEGTGGLTAANLSTDRRQYVAGLGGLLPVASQAERDALAAYDGMPIYRRDKDAIEIWNGASWDRFNKSPGLIQTGTAVVSLSGTLTGTASFTFPTGYASTPGVVATASSGAYNIAVTAVSATGATVTARHIDGASTTATIDVYWMASGIIG